MTQEWLSLSGVETRARNVCLRNSVLHNSRWKSQLCVRITRTAARRLNARFLYGSARLSLSRIVQFIFMIVRDLHRECALLAPSSGNLERFD